MFLICIDGSGPRGSDEYRDAQRGSFVRELFDEFQRARVRSLYLRGPNTGSFGLRRLMARQCPSQVRSLATMAEATVLRLWREGVRGPVGFAGHSRGGAACIEACRRLQSSLRELRVDILALFDAVDRDPFTNTQVIPGNVLNAYHAVRDDAVLSRPYFGHTGLSIEPPGKLETKPFYGTHAALGGTPFTGDRPMRPELPPGTDLNAWALMHEPTYGQPPPVVWVPTIDEAGDRVAAQRVKQWMWSHIRRHLPGPLGKPN